MVEFRRDANRDKTNKQDVKITLSFYVLKVY